jgi:solute carrier family 25 phosphate transporter 3
MILTETYKSTTPGSFGSVIKKIWGRGGVSQFFIGTQARLVHVGGIITQQLVVYDIVKQLLGLPATGSH